MDRRSLGLPLWRLVDGKVGEIDAVDIGGRHIECMESAAPDVAYAKQPHAALDPADIRALADNGNVVNILEPQYPLQDASLRQTQRYAAP